MLYLASDKNPRSLKKFVRIINNFECTRGIDNLRFTIIFKLLK